jgi:maltose O-acetyltransferase
MSLKYIWINREKQKICSRRWFVIWIKRLLQLPSLLQIFWSVKICQIKRADIGKMVVLSKAKFHGNLHKLKVGDYVSIGCCNIHLHDEVFVGTCAVINDGVEILTATHDLLDPKWRHKKNKIVIGEYAWIATNAIILPGVNIGRGAVIGAGAVVRNDVPDYAVVIGNPSIEKSYMRSRDLNYAPSFYNAPFEAWIGRNIVNINIKCGGI